MRQPKNDERMRLQVDECSAVVKHAEESDLIEVIGVGFQLYVKPRRRMDA